MMLSTRWIRHVVKRIVLVVITNDDKQQREGSPIRRTNVFMLSAELRWWYPGFGKFLMLDLRLRMSPTFRGPAIVGDPKRQISMTFSYLLAESRTVSLIHKEFWGLSVLPTCLPNIFCTTRTTMQSLLRWSVENSSPGGAPPVPRKDLDPGIIDHILGKPDAQLMKEALEVAVNESQIEDDRLRALEDLEMVCPPGRCAYSSLTLP